MKKKLMVIGLCAIAALLFGAVVAEKNILDSKVISSWSDLFSAYNSRPGLPPLPDFEPLTIYKMIQAKDYGFTTNANWLQTESGGTFYVSKNSKKLQKLKFPLTIRIYDYLPTGETYVLSSIDGEKFKSEAAFKSEPLTDELFSELTKTEQTHDLLFSIWRTRTVWEITLKAESEQWGDLLSTRSATASTESSAEGGGLGGMMMSMSMPPPEYSNDLWLSLETDGGTNTLNIFAPGSLTNIEVFATESLLSGFWTRIATNVNPSGPTNPAAVSAGSFEKKFFRACTWGDADSDGLSDGQELYEYKTDPDNEDTDGDGIPDGWELKHNLDPLSAADSDADRDSDGLTNVREYLYDTDLDDSDTDDDGMPDGWEVDNGINPLVDDAQLDPDGDGIDNLHEYLADSNPQSDFSAVETMIFDEDNHTLNGKGDYTAVITNIDLAYRSTKCLMFSVTNNWHYYSQVDFEDASFGNSDTLEFYIRSTAGTCTNMLRVWVYYSDPSEMSAPVDIRPYLYDTNGISSPGSVTETYKKVSIPWSVLQQGGSNQVGTIRHMRLGILDSEKDGYPYPKNFYVDRISLQDKQGLSINHVEVLDARHVKLTGDNQLDFISARTLTNHSITSSLGSSITVTNIGLRSWVTGFMGSGYDAPTMEHDIYLELADPLVSEETYTYSNNVQDISGNYPADGVIQFTFNDQTNITSSIKVNQVGWLPGAEKTAYVGNWLGDLGKMLLDTNVSHTAYIVDAGTGLNVYTSQLVRATGQDLWDPRNIGVFTSFSGEEVWQITFTDVTAAGTYFIQVPGIGRSYDFEIGSNVYADVYYHCMRSLWFQRSGICMTNPAYSGIWARQGDLQQNTNTAFYHASIYSLSPDLFADEPINSHADFNGGWYDAADYDKYTATGCDAVNNILTMYEICPERFTDNQLNIPESTNGIPDVLDEAKWELDWIAKMVSSNGAAFNKCTYESWPDGMPSEQTGKMWVTEKTTRDTAAACAILAKAARIYAPYDSSVATLYSNKATLAWQCLTNHPDSYPIPPGKWDDYNNPPETTVVINDVSYNSPKIGTGTKFSTNDMPDRIWAALEMFRLTDDVTYHEAFLNLVYQLKGPTDTVEDVFSRLMSYNWHSDPPKNPQKLISYIYITNSVVNTNWQAAIRASVLHLTEGIYQAQFLNLPYNFELKSITGIGYGTLAEVIRPYYYILAYEVSGETNWLNYAVSNLDWPLGANPLSMSFITGVGSKYPMFPHQKISDKDGIVEPIPGFNIYGPAYELPYVNDYKAYRDHSYPPYQYQAEFPDLLCTPYARRYVDVEPSVKHGEFVIDDLARTAMVFAYFSSTNAP